MIDMKDKIVCLEMFSSGISPHEIYDTYYKEKYPDTKYETFRRMLYKWKNRVSADDVTLRSGTYPNFDAHGATVQVNKSGEVVQAWIKQHSSSVNIEELIDAIKDYTQPKERKVREAKPSKCMLEIPMYDMHFPLSSYDKTLDNLIYLITSKDYDEINLIIGQDLFHNDDFRGRTSSGRAIEHVDMIEAWRMAEDFWYSIISHALDHANRVILTYSKGNHDESLAWAFVQRLDCMFPALYCVDDTLEARKCIYWEGCFIGLTHGYSKKNSDPKSMRSIFSIEYPQEFAKAKVREIHAGHLHHEEASDLFGVTVRRLSTSVPTDEWSYDEGYVGAHKRFMIFEWEPGKLKSIHFV